MLLLVTTIPNTWKQLLVLVLVVDRFLFADRNVLVFALDVLHFTFLQRVIAGLVRILFWLRRVVGSKHQWSLSILFATEIIDKTYRIVYIVHVDRGIRVRADQRGEISGIAEHHERITPQCQLDAF